MSTDNAIVYANEVAEKLGETRDSPRQQIELMIQHLGQDFVTKVLEETEKVEDDGGMKTDNGKRRRTKGGVFFYLAKGKMDAATRKLLFPNVGQPDKGSAVEWDDRLEHIQPLLDGDSAGSLRYATLKLIGRPNEDIHIEGNTVLMTLTQTHDNPPLPRGVPQFPADAVPYTVYMSLSHWRAVESIIENDPQDNLIIEGNVYLDSETNTIAVAAMNVTTQGLLKQTRQAERAAAKKKASSSVEVKAKSTAADPKAKPKKEPRLHNENQTNGTAKAATKSPAKPAVSRDDYDIPAEVPDNVAEELAQLYSGAETLRERIAIMEQNNQSGVKMTKKLLRNTERKIEKLKKSYLA